MVDARLGLHFLLIFAMRYYSLNGWERGAPLRMLYLHVPFQRGPSRQQEISWQKKHYIGKEVLIIITAYTLQSSKVLCLCLYDPIPL